MRVKIKQLPKKAYGGQQAGGALNVTPNDFNGNYSKAKEGREVKQSLTSIPRSQANLEAEGGETAFGPISGDTIPDHFKITGPRHHSGGVPLNLPEDTFIFSDTKAMRITDPSILKMFSKTPKKGGHTPADLAKPYDINKYKAILMDPDSDRKSRETATLMIKNYIMKLGALALAQESKKGFPQGIPEMARPYMEANNITDEDLIVQEAPEGAPAEQPLMKNGGLQKFKGPGDSQVDMNPKQGENMSDWMLRTIGNPGFVRSTQTWNGTSWVEEDGSSSNQQNNSFDEYNNWNDQSIEQQALAKYNRYKNRTNNPNMSNLVLYYPNLNDPVYRKILEEYKDQSNNINKNQLNNINNVDPYNFYGNSGFINNSNSNFYNSNSNAEIFPFYNTGNAGRYNLDFSNPFSNRAFRRAGNYLTPMGAQRMTGPGFDNIPISGFPQDAKLTSIGYKFKKNPLLKALLNRDIARKELEYKFNFNGDLSKFTDNVDVEDVDVEDVETKMSNRAFANENIDNRFGRFGRFGRKDKRKLLRDLNSGLITQEEFLANQEFINNSEENLVDSEELDENIDAENVEVEDQDTDVPPYGGLIINNPMADAPNMQKAFGGENQMLNTFVYGGNYVQGGFQSPIERDEVPPYGGLINEFNPMTVNNDNLTTNNDNLTTNYANAGPGQLTADLIDNQSDKDALEKILNKNDNKEEEKEGSFSIEGKQKINTAWDFNPEDFRQQAAKVANIGTQAGRLIQDAKEKDSMNRLRLKQQQNANVSQQNFYGTELANETGVFATAAMSDPNTMRSLGTSMGQLGGSMPMDKYGANMGGSYYPTMSTGGSSRIRIKSLPSKDKGGTPGHAHPHSSSSTTYIGGSPEWAEWYNSDNSKDYRTNAYNAYKARREGMNLNVLNEEKYNDIYKRAQRQFYDMGKDYDKDYLDNPEWDSKYAYKDGEKDLSDERGVNWKYKKTLEEMNAKLKADNPGMSQAELDKKLYTELTPDEINNFQSAYIANKFAKAKAGESQKEILKYIHEGVNDQTVDGESISPEDSIAGNTTNRQLGNVTIKNEDGTQNCNCYPLGADGKADQTKDPISTTTVKAGETCPPCDANVSVTQNPGDTPDEPYRYSRQDGRNLLAAARFETEAERISPYLVDNQEISGVLVNPYVGDITAQLKAGMSSINTQGAPTAQRQAQRMQMFGKGVEATGNRFATTRDKNAAVANRTEQFNAQSKGQTDARNQQAITNADLYNAGAADKSLQARNAKIANMNLTERAAQYNLQKKAMNNLFNPNMKIGYSNDLPYYSAKYRDAMLNRNVTANNTDPNKTKPKTKTKTNKYGGSINSDTFIPRYSTMPYNK